MTPFLKNRSISPAHTIRWALLASFLFALSTPPSKILSGEQTPFFLVGLFYLGSLLAIVPSLLLRLLYPGTPRETTATGKEENIFLPLEPTGREVATAVASVLIGGGAAPLLLIWGLRTYPASLGSLLLNAEGIITVILSWILFREPFNKRLATGAILGAAGCAIASTGDPLHGTAGAIPFLLAAGLWALDSNLLRLLSRWNPLTITFWKGSGSALLLLPLGLWLPHPKPEIGVVLGALATGAFGYGLSLILFIRSIRSIGVSATGAWFSISPFLGAILSVLLLKEPLTARLTGAAALLLIAVLFLNAPVSPPPPANGPDTP